VRLEALDFELLDTPEVLIKFELEFTCSETPEGLGMQIDYSADIFESSTIERMGEHFRLLLEQIVLDPQCPLQELQLLGPPERHYLLHELNATQAPYPQACIHQLFEEQVERTPQKVALVFEGQSLSYEQLNERSNRLAHYLREAGVQPDSCVGICIERSVEMVVGLLGILKAGGAYVPLDPGYPPERLAYMLEDSAPRVLLVHGATERLCRGLGSEAVLCNLDEDSQRWAECSARNPSAQGLLPSHLAYVIYTSGSTGRPKGVMVEHAGIVNRLLWMQAQYGLQESDCVMQKTPFSFDVSVWEFFWPLLQGAKLVVAKPEGHQDPYYLSELIGREGITTLHFVPPMLEAFLGAADLTCCASLRQVMCSGQALPLALTQRFFEVLPGVRLHNLYGPTEASVDVSSFECCAQSALGCVPIGRPIWNTRLYVLDGALQPVPLGVAGELHIGGVGLARGYLNEPQLTEAKFIRDPFVEGERLYKTGDLARVLSDGNIEYLGRLDDQVKIRGFRIELGEIESCLRESEGVQEALVVAREQAEGERRLVAYVVGQKQSAGAELIDGIKAHLATVLPQYMLPSAYVLLEALPLTPNGKVDRKALPAPDASLSAAQYIAPRTDTEEKLAAIWREVLKLERVGIHDNFFSIGGNSLNLLHSLRDIKSTFDVELAVKDLFVDPNIEQIAKVINAINDHRRLTQELAALPADEIEQMEF